MTDQSETRRLAIEIIATLANVKRTCADRLLRKAGIADDLIRHFLTDRDPTTGCRSASANVVPLLKQSSDTSVVLMDGYDLRAALAGDIDLRQLMQAKVRTLNLSGEPFHSAAVLT